MREMVGESEWELSSIWLSLRAVCDRVMVAVAASCASLPPFKWGAKQGAPPPPAEQGSPPVGGGALCAPLRKGKIINKWQKFWRRKYFVSRKFPEIPVEFRLGLGVHLQVG